MLDDSNLATYTPQTMVIPGTQGQHSYWSDYYPGASPRYMEWTMTPPANFEFVDSRVEFGSREVVTAGQGDTYASPRGYDNTSTSRYQAAEVTR
jgi:hypothetical protein